MEPTTAPGPEAAEASEGSAPAAAPAARGGGAAGVRALRRPSFVPPNALEPLIVVEESFDGDEDDELAAAAAGPPGGEQRDRDRDESPSPPADDVNPYLLSPWRDTRKSSLPTPACASGITASQVRRLSERGPESGPSPREQEFLATLSAMPGPAPGGRRHSVVISRVPPPSLIMFGRGRRESIAAFSAAASRREALASSTHNLQLDLMDDLLEFKAAKKVSARRASEATGLAGLASQLQGAQGQLPLVNRRKSELPPRLPREFAEEVAELAKEAAAQQARRDEGIVCSNSDLLHLLGSPDKSGPAGSPCGPPGPPSTAVPATTPPAASSATPRLATLRAGSVDVEPVKSTVLVSVHGDRTQCSLAPRPSPRPPAPAPPPAAVLPPQPPPPQAAPPAVRPAPEGGDAPAVLATASTSGVQTHPVERRDSEKVIWDERSGSIVDAGVLGSAIEGFLNKDTGSPAKNKKGATNSVHRATAQLSAWVTAVAIWNPRSAGSSSSQGATPQSATPQGGTPQPTPQDTPQATPRRRRQVSCDAVCSTLKSLFVK